MLLISQQGLHTMVRLLSFVLIYAAAYLSYSAPASANYLSDYCSDRKNTIDTVRCLNDALMRLQTELQTAFDETLGNAGPDLKQSFAENHRLWIQYRNSTCQWEQDLVESESLRHIQDLSCQARLTHNRIETIKLSALTVQEQMSERGASSQWKNVLRGDFPGVHWRFDDHIQADLNCNGMLERITSGLQIKTTPSGEVVPEYVLSVVEEPATGRPTPQTFIFNFETPNAERAPQGQTLQSELFICSANYGLELRTIPRRKPMPQDAAGQCPYREIIISHDSCPPYHLIWADGMYSVRADNNTAPPSPSVPSQPKN